MPIKGLTDDIAPRLPSLGKLRKGAEKPERGPGKDLQHFRFTGAKPEIEQAFIAAYGEAPGSLTVYLPYPSADACFETWQEEWAAGGLVHRCDGQVMSIWREGAGYVRGQKPCPYFTGEKQRIKNRQPGCDEVGRLLVILPDLVRAGHVGYVTLETHSKHDMLNILGALKAAEEHAGERGLLGIPFTLYRREEEISTPTDEGGRATRKKWLVYIEPQAAWVQVRMQLAHAEALALPAPEPTVIDGETGEIVEPAAPKQLAAPASPPPAQQQATHGHDDEFDGPPKPKAGPGMWKQVRELMVEARAFNLEFVEPVEDISAEAMALYGKQLRARIEVARAQAEKKAAAPKATTAPAPAQTAAGAGTATAPATKPAGEPTKMPGPRMWHIWNELAAEAKALGLAVPMLTEGITAPQLSYVGASLRKLIATTKEERAQAEADTQRAAQAINGKKKTFTRDELIAYVKALGESCKKAGLVGLAWTVNPKWDNDTLVQVGKDLEARLAEKQTKEPAHV